MKFELPIESCVYICVSTLIECNGALTICTGYTYYYFHSDWESYDFPVLATFININWTNTDASIKTMTTNVEWLNEESNADAFTIIISNMVHAYLLS